MSDKVREGGWEGERKRGGELELRCGWSVRGGYKYEDSYYTVAEREKERLQLRDQGTEEKKTGSKQQFFEWRKERGRERGDYKERWTDLSMVSRSVFPR